MSPFPTLQIFLEQLTTRHNVDFRYNSTRLHLTLDGLGELLVENVGRNCLTLIQKFEHGDGWIETPLVLIFVGARTWTPISMKSGDDAYVGCAVAKSGRRIVTIREEAHRKVVETCAHWADALIGADWIEHGEIKTLDRGEEVVAEEHVGRLLTDLGIIVGGAR